MKLSCNMIKIHSDFGLKKMIDVLVNVGFEGLDFNNDLEGYRADEHDKDFYLDLKKFADSKGFKFCQAHAPFPSSFADAEQTDKRFNEIVTSMRNASYLGAPIIVVHPCYHLDTISFEANFEYNINFYKRLAPYAKQFGIKIALENLGSKAPYNVCDGGDKIAELFDALNDPNTFTVCFDVGHCGIVGKDPAQEIRKLGYRIGCTHVHDNDGIHDSHTLPYSDYGTVDWESVMKALADVDYKGDLNYEASAFFKKAPLEIRTESLRYMASVGHYLIDRFYFYKENK